MSRVVVARDGRVTFIHDAAAYPDFEPDWLDRDYWGDRGAAIHSHAGRSFVLMLERGGERWVHRHYHRGGLVSRFVEDRYLWAGFERSRPFREWRLLEHMHAQLLPVPRPVAARAVRSGLTYRADIITLLIPEARPLSAFLAESGVADATWTKVGSMIRQFHDCGIDHPDLTAHNVLVDSAGRTFLVDFDNAVRRRPGSWTSARIARLKRSFRKVALERGDPFDERAWSVVLQAYSNGRA